MKLLKLLLLVFLVGIVAVPFVSAKTCVYFFYGNGCLHCAKVMPFIDQMASKYPDLDIKRFEIYDNRQNAIMLESYFDAYNVSYSERGIPAVFVSSAYLSGDTPILKGFEYAVQKFDGALCPVVAGQDGGVKGYPASHIIYAVFVIAAVVVLFLLLNKWVRHGRWRV